MTAQDPGGAISCSGGGGGITGSADRVEPAGDPATSRPRLASGLEIARCLELTRGRELARGVGLARRVALGVGVTALVGRMADVKAAPAEPPVTAPRMGDALVFDRAGDAGAIVHPGELVPGAPPRLAWAMRPHSHRVLNQSRFNLILLLRLPAARLGTTEIPLAADGIVAYSAVCTHAGCLVSGWNPLESLVFCACHGSVYDPAIGAKVVAGPAPRSLPALPLRIEDDVVTATGGFTARIGGSTGRTD